MDSYEDFMTEKYWKKNRPQSMHFELTNLCNERCIHCLYTKDSSNELSAEEIQEILLQLEEIGVFYLSLSGGEIFVRKDIEDILDFLLEHRFLLTIYTNGTLLRRSSIERLKSLNPQSMEISVYGATAEVHDAITKVPGSFQKTISSIRTLKDAGLNTILKGFLLKDNFNQRRQMVDMAGELGVLHAMDFNLIPMEDGNISNLSTGLTYDQINRVYQEVATEGLILRNTIKIESSESQLPKGGSVVCNAGRINGCIGPNGDVYPCPILRVPIGNLREMPFDEIWNTGKIDAIRYMTIKDLKTCAGCPTLESCNRCPGVAYLETGDYLGPAPASVCNKYSTLTK